MDYFPAIFSRKFIFKIKRMNESILYEFHLDGDYQLQVDGVAATGFDVIRDDIRL
jgi:hypothetical protein